MSPTSEQEILAKLHNIWTVLMGFEGQESTGFINRTEAAIREHGLRTAKAMAEQEGRFAKALEDQGKEMKEVTDDHDDRITSLEKWMWRCIGALGLAAAVIEYLRRTH